MDKKIITDLIKTRKELTSVDTLKANLKGAKDLLNGLNDLAKELDPLRKNISFRANNGLVVALNSGYAPTFIFNGYHYNVEIIEKMEKQEILVDYELDFCRQVENISVDPLDIDLAIDNALVDFRDYNTYLEDQAKEEQEEEDCE